MESTFDEVLLPDFALAFYVSEAKEGE